ncbi:NAD(P)/FAD-dependent oxidoreductase [Algoriphagus halophytocola]|uniref:NAD(P)/FAD-dependent oxidoreductase n=1 Tax=Algoriphagus halophytocola TaxID=2991499 RepID=A0ABY6MDD3_9BACT|nr:MULTISPECIES: NAD(P)/FAD-dependent oxidoreductase [unclassified Algoriphagus]UZD21755.1 NAD(P)/FAD-dependent oxidoreductase [Algoriphagus sp. TR-M5]WBL42967.1 NAD(P)/FAD-dependent oxidoreductase [Algoriphagus sp. TR-M9]
MHKYEIIIVGGGLAGLVSGFLLAKSGKKVLLIEKKTYPFHRVCGEYVSKEVEDFLRREALLPTALDLPRMTHFHFSDTSGSMAKVPLDLGGFGISRYVLDDYLFQQAKAMGVSPKTGAAAETITFDPTENHFKVGLRGGEEFYAEFVIGAFGKRSKLDKTLNRPFIAKRSPYIGVKYHIRTEFDTSAVALHNFDGGYCGLNAIEEGKGNLCYLGSREALRQFGSLDKMEREILWKNPHLNKLFNESDFLLEKPEVINEINFEKKKPVENHILMAGDSAGLITPLCGNGMAMAIHAGKLAAEAILQGKDREQVENLYARGWKAKFERRLWVGRNSQRLFGGHRASGFARSLISNFPGFAKLIISQTHGKVI